ncbi:hypothetical protein AGMMS49940_22440 [Spirochaetia bacterium]|nr:hypothetical protein AGMMS49940_22440 [Spirochaetia bacterium]
MHEVGFTQEQRAEFFLAVSGAVSEFPFIGDATDAVDSGNRLFVAYEFKLDFRKYFLTFDLRFGDILVLTCWADDGNEVEMAEFPLGNLRRDFVVWFKEFFNERD